MKRFLCTLGNHAAAPGEVRNQGFAFSRCRCCGRDLVRSNRAWRTVPRGFRVVWRRPAAGPAEFSAAQLLLDLPAAGRALTIVARRRRRRIAAMVELAVTGLRVLLEAGAQRVRTWRRALTAPRPARPLLLRLPAH